MIKIISLFFRFAQLLESIFTIPFAIQMSIATIGISITLLQVRICLLFIVCNLQRIEILHFSIGHATE